MNKPMAASVRATRGMKNFVYYGPGFDRSAAALEIDLQYRTLVKLAEAVALSGVEETDPRIDWVNLQVDRVFLAALRAEIKRVKG